MKVNTDIYTIYDKIKYSNRFLTGFSLIAYWFIVSVEPYTFYSHKIYDEKYVLYYYRAQAKNYLLNRWDRRYICYPDFIA